MSKSDKRLIILALIILGVLFCLVSKVNYERCIRGGNSEYFCESELLK